MHYDVVIVGGGPAGLSAALVLARGRKRVLLCDSGSPRNAAAEQIHGFVTRDGTPPSEFRRIGREQLRPYDSVEVRDAQVTSVEGERGAFVVRVGDGDVQARRVLVSSGMIDVMPETPGYRELWAKSIFQCPYCHGWEVRDRPFAALITSSQWLEMGLFFQGWSRDLIVFTDGACEVPDDVRARFAASGVGIEERRIRRLVSAGSGKDKRLEAIDLEDGARIPREVVFARPEQRQAKLVSDLGLELDEQGFVRVDAMGQTSRPGIYAAGDLTTMKQGALVAAAAGAMASYAMNHELTMEPAAG